jgi:hypothetical protein
MFPGFRYFITLVLFTCFILPVSSQDNSSSGYLYHMNQFNDLGRNVPKYKRKIKLRLEAGLVFGYYNPDAHYTNNSQALGGYELGLKIETPPVYKSSFITGCELFNQSLSFNSYYFAKGYSFLYNPSEEIYNHSINFTELHFPFEYKISFSPENKKVSTWYVLIGWVYRFLLNDNTLVTNNNTGNFVFEGQNNLLFKYPLFSNSASSAIAIAFGWQRNFLKNGDAIFVELAYDYGLSPIIYTGNDQGSNYIEFTDNTLSLKIGMRL